MDIQVSNDAICGFLECPICRGIAANAMSLSCCGHAICEGCADRIAGQPCPTCESRACTFRASRPIRSSVDEVRVGCDLCASQIRLAERLVHRPELCPNRMLRWTVSGCGLAACASECREQIASARLDAFMADHSELMEGRWPAVAGGGLRWPRCRRYVGDHLSKAPGDHLSKARPAGRLVGIETRAAGLGYDGSPPGPGTIRERVCVVARWGREARWPAWMFGSFLASHGWIRRVKSVVIVRSLPPSACLLVSR